MEHSKSMGGAAASETPDRSRPRCSVLVSREEGLLPPLASYLPSPRWTSPVSVALPSSIFLGTPQPSLAVAPLLTLLHIKGLISPSINCVLIQSWFGWRAGSKSSWVITPWYLCRDNYYLSGLTWWQDEMKTHKTPLGAVARCFLAAQGWLPAS